MTKIYRSRLLASVHETAQGLNDAGILDNPDMQMFNVLCLTDETPQPADTKPKPHKKMTIGLVCS